MTCKLFKDLEGCGNCTIKLTNSSLISSLSATSILDVFDTLLLWCVHNTKCKLDINNSTISCEGLIDVVYIMNTSESNRIKDYSIQNRTACKHIVQCWYLRHTDIVRDALAIVYLGKAVELLNKKQSENELLQQIIELTNALTVLTDRY